MLENDFLQKKNSKYISSVASTALRANLMMLCSIEISNSASCGLDLFLKANFLQVWEDCWMHSRALNTNTVEVFLMTSNETHLWWVCLGQLITNYIKSSKSKYDMMVKNSSLLSFALLRSFSIWGWSIERQRFWNEFVPASDINAHASMLGVCERESAVLLCEQNCTDRELKRNHTKAKEDGRAKL